MILKSGVEALINIFLSIITFCHVAY